MVDSTLEILLSQVKSLKIYEKKLILGRQRLRITNEEIAIYIAISVEHFQTKVYYKTLYHKYINKINCNYQNFMKKLKLIAPLFQFLFHRLSRLTVERTKIRKLDSSLISCLSPTSIRHKHWDNKVATKREDKRGNVYYVAGLKLFLILNEYNYILDAHVTNINQADITQLRKTAYKFKDTILLADRGFNSKDLQKSITTFKLISPPRSRYSKPLSIEEKRLYATRWAIETVFQK